MPYDPTSQSNLDQVKTNHIHLDLTVNFAAKALSGSAELEIEAIADHVNTVVLDTSFIDVKAVSAAGKTLQVPKPHAYPRPQAVMCYSVHVTNRC